MPQPNQFVHILERADGSEIRLTATAFTEVFKLQPTVSVFAHRRASPDAPWVLLGDQPHPDWRSMSVAEYCERGRPEFFVAVSFGERIRFRAAALAALQVKN